MADDWKPEGARPLASDDWKPDGARPLGALPEPGHLAMGQPTDIGGDAVRLFHTARHLGYGMGDKVIAGLQAIDDVRRDKTGKVTLGDAYARDIGQNDTNIEASDKLHPVEKWEGNALGFAGSMAAPAAVLKGLRLLRAAPAAVGAAVEAAPRVVPTLLQLAKSGFKTGAAIGGVGGFGGSRAPVLSKQMAEDVGVSGLVGGVAGGVLAPTTALIGRGLVKSSNKLAAKALRGTSGEYKKLGADGVQELGNWLHENGLIKAFDKPGNIAGRVEGELSSAGNAMKSILAKAEQEGVAVDPETLAAALDNAADEAGKYGPSAAPRVEQLRSAAEQARAEASQLPRRFVGGKALGRTLTPEQAELWKQGYQQTAYPRGAAPMSPTPAQATDMEIAALAKKSTEDALDNQMAGTGIGNDFRAAKSNYGNAKRISKILQGAEGREESRDMTGSLTDKLMLVTHGPLAAIAHHEAAGRLPSTLAVGSRLLGRALSGGTAPAVNESVREAVDPQTQALIRALWGKAPAQSLIPAGAVASGDMEL